MLVKQSQVLTNLASLDEEEAARAESAALRWQVSSSAPTIFLSLFWCASPEASCPASAHGELTLC